MKTMNKNESALHMILYREKQITENRIKYADYLIKLNKSVGDGLWHEVINFASALEQLDEQLERYNEAIATYRLALED